MLGLGPDLLLAAMIIYHGARRRGVLHCFWAGKRSCAGGALPELHISPTLVDEPAETLLCVLDHAAVRARVSGIATQDALLARQYYNPRFVAPVGNDLAVTAQRQLRCQTVLESSTRVAPAIGML